MLKQKQNVFIFLLLRVQKYIVMILKFYLYIDIIKEIWH